MIYDRLIGCSATQEENNSYYTDVGQILRRLLIFEEYTIKSIRLKEFEALSNTLGIDSTLSLIKESPLRIVLDPSTTAQTAQASIFDKRIKYGPLPLGCYSFSNVAVYDMKDHISKCLSESTNNIRAPKSKIKSLKLAIVEKLEKPSIDINPESLKQTYIDLRAQTPTLNYLIERNLKKTHKLEPNKGELKINVISIDEDDFKIETNIGKHSNLDIQEEHKIVERSVLELAGLNRILAEMKHFNAMTGFKETDIEALQLKLDFIYREINPTSQEDRFTRIIEILDLPDFSDIEYGQSIDIEKFIASRDSDDCKKFREWLTK